MVVVVVMVLLLVLVLVLVLLAPVVVPAAHQQALGHQIVAEAQRLVETVEIAGGHAEAVAERGHAAHHPADAHHAVLGQGFFDGLPVGVAVLLQIGETEAVHQLAHHRVGVEDGAGFVAGHRRRRCGWR